MLLLAMDTSGATGSVVLAESTVDGGLKSVGAVELPGRTFSVRLMPAISALLQQHEVTLAAVDGLVVVRGPGSFTGLRVGLSAVKGLAEAARKPVIAISRLAVMAAMQPTQPFVHAILDAGRGEFYHGAYRDAGWTCVQESLQTAEALRAVLAMEKNASIIAESSVATALQDVGAIAVANPAAEDALTLALRCWKEKQFTDVALLDANYLRRSDAELFARPKG